MCWAVWAEPGHARHKAPGPHSSGHAGHVMPTWCQTSAEEGAKGFAPTHQTATRSSPGGMVPCSCRELPPHQASCRQQLVLSLPWSSGYSGWMSCALRSYQGPDSSSYSTGRAELGELRVGDSPAKPSPVQPEQSCHPAPTFPSRNVLVPMPRLKEVARGSVQML